MFYLESCEDVGHIRKSYQSSDTEIINETLPTDSNNSKGVFSDTQDGKITKWHYG